MLCGLGMPAAMYKFVTSMVLCGLGMQQCAMHNATIQKTTFLELGVYMYFIMNATVTLSTDVFKAIHLVKSTNYPRNCHDIKFIP